MKYLKPEYLMVEENETKDVVKGAILMAVLLGGIITLFMASSLKVQDRYCAEDPFLLCELSALHNSYPGKG